MANEVNETELSPEEMARRESDAASVERREPDEPLETPESNDAPVPTDDAPAEMEPADERSDAARRADEMFIVAERADINAMSVPVSGADDDERSVPIESTDTDEMSVAAEMPFVDDSDAVLFRDDEALESGDAEVSSTIDGRDLRHSTSTIDHEAPSFMSEVPESFTLSDGTASDESGSTGESAEPEAEGITAPRSGVRGRSEPRSPDSMMLVNDVPGDECRIALVRKGRLESFFGERVATATNVGNIYKGRVINVEPAIQAAFVDFGQSQNGFLHVSDLHPRYFPGGGRTEAVGRKIPRRDRPLIQEALKRGQEILVQVIKEGIGTKGPTLTSYLSIPGRLLVMMPEMDNVGVSRKVEDEDQRRQMRKILDSLELPEGFGFILRTAGFDRSRVELQRDAAYLMRLWEAMERRMDRSGAPCELYTESDLLLRIIRDMVDDSVSAIVVDSESAFDRASLFLDVAFPKDPPEVRYYDRPAPIFHAFGVEPQVRSIYTREVALASGGALVFDQAEAMLAIDVNSGKSRSARDSETNAFNTNREAVDEICRQLRLRDLGGLVVCDLIDMRSAKHRREIEDRFRENLRHDRAKTTVLPISEFGLIELTRQRMRPSVQKMHFMACPHCEGIGQVQIPESTAAAALRNVQALLGHDRVHRVEMVCSVKVASVMLSSKRERLYEVERRNGKRVDVRISEALPIDRVDLYGYDERGADVELARLSMPKPPTPDSLPTEPPEELDFREAEVETNEGGGRRRGGRRRRRAAPADAASIAMAGGFDDLPEVRGDEPSALEEIKERERTKRDADAARAAQPDAKRPARADDDADRGDAASSDRDDGRRRRKRGGRGRGRDRDGVAPSSDTKQSQTASSDAGPSRGRGRGGPAPTGTRSASPARTRAAATEPPPPPEPMRVHLLAKELGILSKDLLAALRERETKELVFEAKNHMSMLSSPWVALAKSIYAPEPPAPALADETMVEDDDADGSDDGPRDGEDFAPSESSGPGDGEGEGGRKKRRRRRRGRRGGRDDRAPGQAPGDAAPAGASGERAPRGDRGGRNAPQGGDRGTSQGGDRGAAPTGEQPTGPDEGGERKRRRRRRGRGGRGGGGGNGGANGGANGGGDGGSNGGSNGGGAPSSAPPPAVTPAPAPTPPKPRGLYARGVRRLSGPVKYDDR